MENYPTNLEAGLDQEIEESLEECRDELNTLKEDIGPKAKESRENYPNTYSFWWVKLNKTGVYTNIPWDPKRLERTGKRRGTNPTYENSCVMFKNGTEKIMNHYERYYTCKDKNFPVSNIEWRIRDVLNKDRERQNLPKIPENQKVRNYWADWTIRDMNWYIVIAANLKKYPRWTLVMTTLWPWRVYDTWKLKENHIDVFTNWPV